MNKKLEDIGKKLQVKGKDIRAIRKKAFTNKIWYWVAGAGIVIVTFGIAYLVGKGSVTCPECICPDSPPTNGGGELPEGYPYSAAVMLPTMLRGRKTSSKIAILLGSALTFFLAIKASSVFGQAILYNVYKR